jgi:protein involved in polysaccharide export with SLBB domain
MPPPPAQTAWRTKAGKRSDLQCEAPVFCSCGCRDAMKSFAEADGRCPLPSKMQGTGPRKTHAIRNAAFVAMLLAALPAWGAYKVQQGDTIEVAVAGIPELRQRTTVQADGAIAFPLVGAVAAVECLTPAELRSTVQTQRARKIYRLRANDGREILTVIQPEEVSAAIVAYRPIYVTGDVAKPGEQKF